MRGMDSESRREVLAESERGLVLRESLRISDIGATRRGGVVEITVARVNHCLQITLPQRI